MGRGAELTEELQERAEQVLERAEELRPVVRRSEIRALGFLRTLIDVALILPRVVVRTLGVVADAIDEVVDRGGALVERGREVAHAATEPRSTRCRRCMKAALWLAGGFAIGFATGWLVAQRQAEELAVTAEELASEHEDEGMASSVAVD